MMRILPGSLRFTRMDRALGEGGEAEREERTSAVLAVVNKLISIRQIPLLTVTSLQGADPRMGGLVRGACAHKNSDGLGGGGCVTNY